MKKHILSILLLSALTINIQHADHQEDLQQEYDDLYDQGYEDRSNHQKPEYTDDYDYMEGYKDSKKYRY